MIPAPPPLPSPTAPLRRAPTAWELRLLWLILALFLVRNLPFRLDDYDQAKQAFTSLEMVQAGHWWFQHTPGYRLLATKPPLVGWVSAAIYALDGGHWELAWRLPSFLAAVALLALVCRAGERLWPGYGGALAGAAFGLNFLTPRLATLVRTDMPLALWIAAAGLILWRPVRDGRSWTRAERWTFGALLLAAMMTKGPVVYAFLLPGLAALLVVTRRRGQPLPDWGGWLAWLLPLAPFVLWVQRGIVTVDGFYEHVVGHEFMGRFTIGATAVHHNQPVYFYFAQLLGKWTMWTALLLAMRFLAPGAWRRVLAKPGNLWLVCWAAGGLLLMSLVPSKRVDRIFPVISPLCLVLCALLAEVEPAWGRRLRSISLAVGAAVALGGAGWSVSQAYVKRQGANASFGAQVRRLTGGRCDLVVAESAAKSNAAKARAAAEEDSDDDGEASAPIGKGYTEHDETMLVYLRRLEFLRPAEALQRISTGKVDALVLSAPARERTRGLLDPSGLWRETAVSNPAPPAAPFLLLQKDALPPPPPPTRDNSPRGRR